MEEMERPASPVAEQTEMEWMQEAIIRQKSYDPFFSEWREFDSSHREYIKSTIGLYFFGRKDVENPPPTVTYFTVYSPERQAIIENVYLLILQQSNSQSIRLSCTYLEGKIGHERPVFCVIRCLLADFNSVRFFDVSARSYENWNDFISYNKLPACQFIAPLDGLYTNNCTRYELFTSPAATITGKITTFVDSAASVVHVGCAGAAYMAVAPTLVGVTAVGIGTYGVFSSVRTLHDRFWHGQSIRLDNRESLFTYGNILATTMTGAAASAAANIARIQKAFGNFANLATNACKVLNMSTLIFDTALLTANATDVFQRYRAGEVTYRDIFNLSLQIFLVSGAVVQVRDMHSMLNQSQLPASSTVNGKLSKTQKRNLQRRRAKARLRGDVIPGTIRVTEADGFTSLKAYARLAGIGGIAIMLSYWPRSVVIYDNFMDIVNLLQRFGNNKVSLHEVSQQLYYHVRNLYTIIKEDRKIIRSFLRLIIRNPTVSDDDTVAQTVNNGLDRIDQTIENIAEAGIGTTAADVFDSTLPDAESDDLSDNEETVSSNRLENRRLILDLVKRNCSEFAINGGAEAFLSYFHSLLTFVTNKLSDTLLSKYNDLSNGKSEEFMKKVEPVLGRKTMNDFYPSDKWFDTVVLQMKSEVDEFVSNYPDRCSNSDHSELAEKVYDTLVTFIDDLFVKVAGTDVVGVAQMGNTLQNVSARLVKKLVDDVVKMSAVADTSYQENMDVLGCEEIVREMLKVLEVPMEPLEIFRIAVDSLDVDAVVINPLQNSVHKDETLVTAEAAVTDGENNETYECIKTVFAKIITKMFEKVKSRTEVHWSEKDTYLYAGHFISKKFCEELESNSEVSELMETCRDLVGPHLTKEIWRVVGSSESLKYSAFREIARILGSEDGLNRMIPQFFDYCRENIVDLHNPKIFETTISEGGFITHQISCNSTESDEYYRKVAEKFFKMQLDASVSVTRGEHCVILRHENNCVTFNFLPEINEALVILTPLNSKEA